MRLFWCCMGLLLLAGAGRADERVSPWNLGDAGWVAGLGGSASKCAPALDGAGKPGALEVTFEPTTDWPFAEMKLPAPQDWSGYSYLSVTALSAQAEDVTVTFELRDGSKKQYKPARRLPAGKWREFRFPIANMAQGTDVGWCGDAIDVKQVHSLALVAHKPRERQTIRVAAIALVRATPLPAPELKASSASDGVLLTWKAVPGAVAYEIRRTDLGSAGSGAPKLEVRREVRLARFPVTRFVDTTAETGKRYVYRVAALNDALGAGAASLPVPAERSGRRPALPQAGRYGGRADVRLKATGFFRTEKRDGRWLLVDPEGHPFFSIGIDVVAVGDTFTRVSRREEQFQDVIAEKDTPRFKPAWTPLYGLGPYGLGADGLVFSRYVREQIVKNGTDWAPAWRKSAGERMAAWGINTFGAWCEGTAIQQARRPYVSFGAGWSGPQIPGARVPDVFDPAFEKSVEVSAAKVEGQKDDPYLIGRFSENELDWFGDWQHGRDVVDLVQGAPATLAAKKAWVVFLRGRYGEVAKLNADWGTQLASFDALLERTEKVPDRPAAQADKEAFFEQLADRYFRITSETLHRHDPNHLALGARFAGSAPEAVIRAAGRHCDVVSINIYEMRPSLERFARYDDLTGKPWLIGEFGFRGQDAGLPNKAGAGPRIPTQQERGEAYQNYLAEALSIPNLVGAHWFQYIDEPATGRFDQGKDGGEDSNYGWVNANDEPYAEFVARAALLNANVPLVLK